jgi:hypothetical protein
MEMETAVEKQKYHMSLLELPLARSPTAARRFSLRFSSVGSVRYTIGEDCRNLLPKQPRERLTAFLKYFHADSRVAISWSFRIQRTPSLRPGLDRLHPRPAHLGPLETRLHSCSFVGSQLRDLRLPVDLRGLRLRPSP